MLGQKSATMTLDLYGHLFPDQLDQVADRLDAAARAVVYPSQHHPDIGGLEETENPPARQAIFRSSPDGIRTRATALRGRSGHRWLCMIGAESCSLKEICARASVGAERPFAAAMCTPCVPAHKSTAVRPIANTPAGPAELTDRVSHRHAADPSARSRFGSVMTTRATKLPGP